MHEHKKDGFNIKDLTLIPALTAILSITEFVLTYVPYVQLSVFLILLYSKKLGFLKTSLIILIHVIIDNLLFGSFDLVFTPVMFLGWLSMPLLVLLFGRKTENPILLSLIGVLGSFIYSWGFVVASVILYEIPLMTYFVGDIVFQLIFAGSSLLTILLLYKPISKQFDHIFLTEKEKDEAVKG